MLLASACLPQCYQAVQIGEHFYWDDGYTGNPALAPLYLGTSATDLIVVGINPIQRTTVPQTARAIIDRIGEISFNSSFMMKLAAVAFVEHLVKSSAVQAPLRLLHVHGIGDEALGSFGASSKMNNQWEFLQRVGVAEQVRQTLLATIGRRTGFNEIARQLGMPARTLRRKLQEQRTSFGELIGELKSHIAIKYLRDTQMTVEDIATALGFSDTANFRQTFRRWRRRRKISAA